MGYKFRVSYFGWLILFLSAIPCFAQPVSISNAPLADNEGTRLGRYRVLDCVGAGVDCTLSNGILTVTISSSDILDFIDFEDTLDLDAALILNQTTNTWSQSFTGTTGIGLTYTANSLTTGDAIDVASSATGLTGD